MSPSQLSWDQVLIAASLALGSWPRSHFTHHRQADTSGLGSVVRHNSWTAAAAGLFPFQKNNKNESSGGGRQALRALEESREAVLKQQLRGLALETDRPKPFLCSCVSLCLEGLTSPALVSLTCCVTLGLSFPLLSSLRAGVSAVISVYCLVIDTMTESSGSVY